MAAETPIEEPIDFARLQVAPGGRDPLLDSLLHNAALLDDALATRVITARSQLLRDLQALDPRDISAAAPAGHYRLSALYAGLIAIAACLAWHRAMPQKLPLPLTQLMVKRQLTHLQLNADDGCRRRRAIGCSTICATPTSGRSVSI
ncbi:Uncharacterised protein [Serratia rubidaea]|uniref:Uncharacterized protein n=1 Tax=Serratia rubidaea TaxID=61652 RepID=A0A4U9HQB0_SERRU|nr:Uncharacterised protein [Serratia rubidaea]